MKLRIAGLLVALTTMPGCLRDAVELAQFPEPAREIPTLELAPPPPEPGLGRVTIDVVDGPEKVYLIEATEQSSVTASAGSTFGYGSGTSERKRYLCETPCVVNLPYGEYETTAGVLKVGPEPTVYRTKNTEYTPGASRFGTVFLLLTAAGASISRRH